jgi:putative transposase
MPDHVHLIIQPQRYEYKLARARKAIKGPVGRRAMNFLRRHSPEWLERLTIRRPNGDVDRHFWQPGGGHARNIVSNEALLNAILYLHANPVRRGLVENPTDWEWSSARFYEGWSDVKLEMDGSLPMLDRS